VHKLFAAVMGGSPSIFHASSCQIADADFLWFSALRLKRQHFNHVCSGRLKTSHGIFKDR
jgi:hypothetical protein